MGPHFYMGNEFNLNQYDEKADYAVFDDFPDGIESLPAWKFWMGGQDEFDVNGKYLPKRHVFWGKASVFLCNYDPLECLKKAHRDWIDGNCVVVHVTKKIAWEDKNYGKLTEAALEGLGIDTISEPSTLGDFMGMELRPTGGGFREQTPSLLADDTEDEDSLFVRDDRPQSPILQPNEDISQVVARVLQESSPLGFSEPVTSNSEIPAAGRARMFAGFIEDSDDD
jgi:hypothetical protein